MKKIIKYKTRKRSPTLNKMWFIEKFGVTVGSYVRLLDKVYRHFSLLPSPLKPNGCQWIDVDPICQH